MFLRTESFRDEKQKKSHCVVYARLVLIGSPLEIPVTAQMENLSLYTTTLLHEMMIMLTVRLLLTSLSIRPSYDSQELNTS